MLGRLAFRGKDLNPGYFSAGNIDAPPPERARDLPNNSRPSSARSAMWAKLMKLGGSGRYSPISDSSGKGLDLKADIRLKLSRLAGFLAIIRWVPLLGLIRQQPHLVRPIGADHQGGQFKTGGLIRLMLSTPLYTTTRGFTVWLTGLSGAGKSTLANALREHFTRNGLLNLAIFDGDDVRTFLCRDLGFTREDREANIRRIGYLSKVLTHHGVPNTVAIISPYSKSRQEVREMVGAFLEVYVACPLEVCERRDVKGLYARARAGEIKLFTGIDDPYEPPENPEVT